MRNFFSLLLSKLKRENRVRPFLRVETEVAKLGDISLTSYVHHLACEVSYYEAAEGSQYTREREERDKAKKLFWEAFAEAEKRGLKIDLRGYLL